MPVLFRRSFLLIFAGKVDLEIIVGAVKEDASKVPAVVLLIAVVEEFDVFLVGSADECAPVIDLILGDRNAVIQPGEDIGGGP